MSQANWIAIYHKIILFFWNMSKDKLYSERFPMVPPFKFDSKVASVFDDMAARSIPHYAIFQDTVTQLASTFYQPGTTIFDLGCSTGNTIIRLIEKLDASHLHITGVDMAKAMLDKCREKLSNYKFKAKVNLRQEDVLQTQVSNASVVTLNFVLQFIPVQNKLEFLTRIATQLPSRGVLIVSEKIKLPSALTQSVFEDTHHQYKAQMGYSQLEIAQKRDALERVLHLKTAEELTGLLQRAGLRHISPVFQWFNFASFIAVKI